jgi:outer membrane protein TolC
MRRDRCAFGTCSSTHRLGAKSGPAPCPNGVGHRVAGCAGRLRHGRPDYEPPKTEVPDLWEQELSEGLVDGKADLRTWWTTLDDPMLDGLIARATEGNLDVARTYVEIRALQSRMASALNNVETQRGALELTIERNRAGLAPDLDVRQAQLNLATTEAFVPPLRSALAANVNSLAVLLGEYPSELEDELAAAEPIPQPPGDIPVSLPADLLRQRPDIREAERNLAAQTAQIGVATGDLYPRFSLSGSFALESFAASDFFK